MYSIKTFFKSVELDDFKEGCIGPGSECQCDVSFSAATVPALLEQVRQFFGVDSDALNKDSCEEIGRLDVCRTENADGDEPTPAEIEQWKLGKLPMWYAVYTGYAYECKPVTLLEQV